MKYPGSIIHGILSKENFELWKNNIFHDYLLRAAVAQLVEQVD